MDTDRVFFDDCDMARLGSVRAAAMAASHRMGVPFFDVVVQPSHNGWVALYRPAGKGRLTSEERKTKRKLQRDSRRRARR